MANEITQTAQAAQDSPERITQKMRVAIVAHFQNGIPIERLGLRPEQRDIVARVEHVYWLKRKNPYLDEHALFYEMEKERLGHQRQGRGNYGNAYKMARYEERILEYVLEVVQPPSRRMSEMKVRAAADKMIRIGMETDNVTALDKGSKRLMELDRLDQPESEQADMSKVSFLPPVVTTAVSDVDDTKEDVDDQEMKRIMQKYGGFVDEKEGDIEKMVEQMKAKANPLTPTVEGGETS